MSRYAVSHTRGNKAQRVGYRLTMARCQNGLLGGNNYYEKYERWEKLEKKICRIPRLFNIEIIELTNTYIKFIAICSDEFYLEASRKPYCFEIK